MRAVTEGTVCVWGLCCLRARGWRLSGEGAEKHVRGLGPALGVRIYETERAKFLSFCYKKKTPTNSNVLKLVTITVFRTDYSHMCRLN